MIFTTSIRYPITFDYVSGKTELDNDVTSINRCIALILTSARGELLGDPDFGSRLYEMLFDQYSDNLQQLIKQEIVDCVTKFESRITLTTDNITIEPVADNQKTAFNITIQYTIIRSNKVYKTNLIMEEDGLNE